MLVWDFGKALAHLHVGNRDVFSIWSLKMNSKGGILWGLSALHYGNKNFLGKNYLFAGVFVIMNKFRFPGVLLWLGGTLISNADTWMVHRQNCYLFYFLFNSASFC